MKIDPDKFDEYMIAKDALHKIVDCATFGGKCELSREEILALFVQKVIDLELNLGMLA